MAHFAEIDNNNVVLRVLVIPNEYEENGEEYLRDIIGLGGRWVQTSYNAKIRGKYAGIGDTYDEELDRFISAKPFPSWILNNDFNWVAPKERPDGNYDWDESLGEWIAIGETK